MIKYFLILIKLVFSIDFEAPYMEKYELENGMSIVLCPIYDQPMIHINTLVKAGEMNDLVGVKEDYDIPRKPDLVVDTGIESVEKSFQTIMDFLYKENLIDVQQDN